MTGERKVFAEVEECVPGRVARRIPDNTPKRLLDLFAIQWSFRSGRGIATAQDGETAMPSGRKATLCERIGIGDIRRIGLRGDSFRSGNKTCNLGLAFPPLKA
jgi:hypothetical protein